MNKYINLKKTKIRKLIEQIVDSVFYIKKESYKILITMLSIIDGGTLSAGNNWDMHIAKYFYCTIFYVFFLFNCFFVCRNFRISILQINDFSMFFFMFPIFVFKFWFSFLFE